MKAEYYQKKDIGFRGELEIQLERLMAVSTDLEGKPKRIKTIKLNVSSYLPLTERMRVKLTYSTRPRMYGDGTEKYLSRIEGPNGFVLNLS